LGTSDRTERLKLTRLAYEGVASMSLSSHCPTEVSVGPRALPGFLGLPDCPKGVVIFVHGSGSGRFSPRNNYVARALRDAGLGTLLLDLLTREEERDRGNVFDIPLLAQRVMETTGWLDGLIAPQTLPIGYFGASTGGGAALAAAAAMGDRVSAVVSRGGRPDLAGDAIPMVRAATLLLVGSLDPQVLELNRWALSRLRCRKQLVVVPGASHLFEEPGTLDIVVDQASNWFANSFAGLLAQERILPFSDRHEAGRRLAGMLRRYKSEHPLVLALPRGGVPVAFEIATALGADLDLLLVRKLGAPDHPETGIGAVIDGAEPEVVLNHEVLSQVSVPPDYIEREARHQLAELERRREAYLSGRPPIPIEGRTVILVDDGIATGGTVRAALRGVRKKKPAKLVLAVPVAPRETIASLRSECDEVICVAMPQPFYAVGQHYSDFTQTSDSEVQHILQAPQFAH
jgi:predicted phosphoribosyltransferase/pimeloyl-ACP methyl ester carboxylesterase